MIPTRLRGGGGGPPVSTLTVKVEEDDIRYGSRDDLMANPVAHAIGRASGTGSAVTKPHGVWTVQLCWYTGVRQRLNLSGLLPLPPWVGERLDAWDAGGPMEPFEFLLEV